MMDSEPTKVVKPEVETKTEELDNKENKKTSLLNDISTKVVDSTKGYLKTRTLDDDSKGMLLSLIGPFWLLAAPLATMLIKKIAMGMFGHLLKLPGLVWASLKSGLAEVSKEILKKAANMIKPLTDKFNKLASSVGELKKQIY